jgi:hypothetical protein
MINMIATQAIQTGEEAKFLDLVATFTPSEDGGGVVSFTCSTRDVPDKVVSPEERARLTSPTASTIRFMTF